MAATQVLMGKDFLLKFKSGIRMGKNGVLVILLVILMLVPDRLRGNRSTVYLIKWTVAGCSFCTSSGETRLHYDFRTHQLKST